MKIIREKDLKEEFVPICPHCEKPLLEIIRLADAKGKGFFSSHDGYCFACPNCRKILGFADFSS